MPENSVRVVNVLCVCPTYKRPIQLANAIACFNWQTCHQDIGIQAHLEVLDDAQQYPHLTRSKSGEPSWRIRSAPERYPSLGEKRNATVNSVEYADAEIIVVWDDDDAYLPNHVSTHVEALLESGADVSIPSQILIEQLPPGELIRKEGEPNRNLFHSGWAFTREAFESVGGYPHMQSGQDQMFLQQLRNRAGGVSVVDSNKYGEPSFIYRWHSIKGHQHISIGDDKEKRYHETFAKLPFTPVDQLVPKLERDWKSLYARLE